jgi:hypothetical protein
MWPFILHSSAVLEVIVQSPCPNSTDEMATSSTSSVLNAINAVASEVSPSAPSSSNQTVANFAMGDVLESTYSSMGNAISSIVANSIFSRFSS